MHARKTGQTESITDDSPEVWYDQIISLEDRARVAQDLISFLVSGAMFAEIFMTECSFDSNKQTPQLCSNALLSRIPMVYLCHNAFNNFTGGE